MSINTHGTIPSVRNHKLYHYLPRWGDVLIRLSCSADARPVRYFAGLLIASALAYVPLAVAFTPSAWFAFGPFGFQLSRPLHYAVYFFGGVGIGACGIERGLFAPDGALVRRWAAWTVAALGFLLVWMVLTALTIGGPGSTSLGLEILDDLSFVVACLSSCFAMLGLVLRFCGRTVGDLGLTRPAALSRVRSLDDDRNCQKESPTMATNRPIVAPHSTPRTMSRITRVQSLKLTSERASLQYSLRKVAASARILTE